MRGSHSQRPTLSLPSQSPAKTSHKANPESKGDKMTILVDGRNYKVILQRALIYGELENWDNFYIKSITLPYGIFLITFNISEVMAFVF